MREGGCGRVSNAMRNLAPDGARDGSTDWHPPCCLATAIGRSGTTYAAEESDDGRCGLRLGDPGVLRTERGIRVRVRKVVTMENTLVGMVAVLLVVYLFWTLVRPEDF